MSQNSTAKLVCSIVEFRVRAEKMLGHMARHILSELQKIPNRFDKDGPWERYWTVPELLKARPDLGLDESSLVEILHWCVRHKDETDVEWHGGGWDGPEQYRIPPA